MMMNDPLNKDEYQSMHRNVVVDELLMNRESNDVDESSTSVKSSFPACIAETYFSGDV